MKAILNEYFNKLAPQTSLAKNPDHIRYCTFACIRTEKEFEEDSENTLRFASQVNSCKNADCDAAACRRRAESGAREEVAEMAIEPPRPLGAPPKAAVRRVVGLGARGGVAEIQPPRPLVSPPSYVRNRLGAKGGLDSGGGAKTRRKRPQGKVRTQRRRRRIVKPKSHPVTVTTQRRNMHDKKKGRRTRKT
jgi:hypothetical protein